MFKYIDIHSHLNLKQFDDDRDVIIQKLKDENIATITVGVDYDSSLSAVKLAMEHNNLFACVGMHPTDSLDEEFDYNKMLELARNEKVVAIGECGLDYFRNDDEAFKNKQKEVFELQIKLALKVDKPLMIHARPSKGTMDAYDDVLDLLESYKKENKNLNANFHFFAGNKNMTQKIIDLGFSMSFDGPITFTHDYDEVIKMIPMELIMAETDAPLVAPAPFRGKRCEPQMVEEIYKKIAEIKGLDSESARKQINLNIKKIFDIQA